MTKVSIIIPTFNRGNLLCEAIQSVLDQTYTDFEIIVVDDGSTDNTRDLVNGFNDSRIRYIYQENQGVSAARNRGIRASDAEYISFLDSDDMYLDNMLERSIQSLDTHPEAGFSYGQSQIMREGVGVYRTRISPFNSDTMVVGSIEQLRELLFISLIDILTVTIRRECLEKIGVFNEDLWYAEDYHLLIRLAKRYSALYIAEPLIIVRYHGGESLQKTEKPGKTKAHSLILQEVFEDPDIAPYYEDIKAKIYGRFHRRMAHLVYNYDMKLARQYMRQSIKYYPWIIFRPTIFYLVYKYLASLLPNRLRLGLRNFKRRFVYTLRQQE